MSGKQMISKCKQIQNTKSILFLFKNQWPIRNTQEESIPFTKEKKYKIFINKLREKVAHIKTLKRYVKT